METNCYVHEDVFLSILLEISDIDDLINACQQNHMTFSLCQRLYFWRMWFNKYYPDINQRPSIQEYINLARILKERERIRKIIKYDNRKRCNKYKYLD